MLISLTLGQQVPQNDFDAQQGFEATIWVKLLNLHH